MSWSKLQIRRIEVDAADSLPYSGTVKEFSLLACIYEAGLLMARNVGKLLFFFVLPLCLGGLSSVTPIVADEKESQLQIDGSLLQPVSHRIVEVLHKNLRDVEVLYGHIG